MSVAPPPPPPSAPPPPSGPPARSRRRAEPPSGPVGERIHNSGLILKFSGLVVGDLVNGRVFMFAGEILRQAGILIVSSTLVTWGLVLFVGLQCGIVGAYLLQAQGAPQYAGQI